MSAAAFALIAFGGFLLGGAVSAIRQKRPLGLIVILSIGAILSLSAAVLRG